MTKYQIDRGVPIPRAKLHPNPWNPNHMKGRQQEAVKESIQEYGQVLELLVRPHPEIEGEYQIIDGEHRFNILPETVFCNVIHGLPDAEAKKLTIVMNETRGSADKIELAQLLSEIQSELGDDLGVGLPYDPTELDELIQLADVNWDQFDSDFEPETEATEDPSNDGFVRFTVAMPQEAMDVVNQARALVEDQRTTSLHSDSQIAWGQVLEALCADFLAMPG